MKRLNNLIAACCIAAGLFATAADAEVKSVTLSVSGMR